MVALNIVAAAVSTIAVFIVHSFQVLAWVLERISNDERRFYWPGVWRHSQSDN
jgi:hypothetical protein